MSRSESLLQWTTCVSSNLPQLSVSQARVLAWWSFGIAMTGSCGRYTVATFLGLLSGQKVATVEQRLYEWCLDAKDKGGKQRQELVLSTCQLALLCACAVTAGSSPTRLRLKTRNRVQIRCVLRCM